MAKDLIEKALNGLEDSERIQYYYPYSDISDEINFEKLNGIIDRYLMGFRKRVVPRKVKGFERKSN